MRDALMPEQCHNEHHHTCVGVYVGVDDNEVEGVGVVVRVDDGVRVDEIDAVRLPVCR